MNQGVEIATETGPWNKEKIIEILTKIISTYISNVEICKWGLNALCSLAFPYDGKVPPKHSVHHNMKIINVKVAVSVGGIETVLKAINTHINNAGVCYAGCCALRNMTVNGKNTDKTQQNK